MDFFHRRLLDVARDPSAVAERVLELAAAACFKTRSAPAARNCFACAPLASGRRLLGDGRAEAGIVIGDAGDAPRAFDGM